MYPFAQQIIGRDLCRTKDDILSQPIDAWSSIESWQIHYNWVRPHIGLGISVRSSFVWRERQAVE